MFVCFLFFLSESCCHYLACCRHKIFCVIFVNNDTIAKQRLVSFGNALVPRYFSKFFQVIYSEIMPVTYIHPKGKHSNLPSFVIPEFTSNDEAPFYPFKRLPEPHNMYETLKTIILTMTIFPIRLIITVTFLFIFAFIAMVGTISYDPQSLDDLAAPLPLWRQVCFKIARFCGRMGLFMYGFHNLSIKHLTYKDMKEKYNYIPPIDIKYDQNGNEIHPRTHIKISNHLGFADILYLLWFHNGSFVSKAAIKEVSGIGTICTAMQSLFVEKFSHSFFD